MPRFIALLRGVNVGRGPRVPMADFRALLEGLGGHDVRTLLNSGNAVFDAARHGGDRLAEAIGAALQERLGVLVPVVVKSAAEFDAALAGAPRWPPEADPSRILVAFGADAAALQALRVIEPLVAPGEQFGIGEHAAYLHCAGGLLDSRAGSALLGKAGRGITTRNWATATKLAALLRAGPA